MNQNETRTLWISIISALFAVFLLYSYTQEKTAQLTKDFGTQDQVVVALRDINEMETIDESMIEVVQRPKKFKEPSSVSDPEIVVGQVALAPIKESEQILSNKIIQPGAITGLAHQVIPGKRAVTIPIDEMRGVGKLLNPGDRIDIVAALDVGRGANQKRVVRTLMQDVAVLATGLRVQNNLPRLFEKVGKDEYIKNIRGDTSFSNITIEANPQEAQNLIYILSTSPGSIFLTLRNPTDANTKISLTPTNINSVLGNDFKPKTAKEFRRPSNVPTSTPRPVTKKKRKSSGFVKVK